MEHHNVTRRNFMKKTALTAGAITLLASGMGLGDEASAMVTPTATPSASASSASHSCMCAGFYYDLPQQIYKSQESHVGNCYQLGHCRCNMGNYSGHDEVESWCPYSDTSTAIYRALDSNLMKHTPSHSFH